MPNQLNKGGRPPMTPEDKAEKIRVMSQQLEPYLKSGLSIRKSLFEAKISKTDFYRMMEEDEGFRDKINQFRNFTSVLLNNALVRELQFIIEKQNGSERNGIRPQPLSREDVRFLMWFALNSNLTKEEFGQRERIDMFDAEAEIQKVKGILEEQTTKEIIHN